MNNRGKSSNKTAACRVSVVPFPVWLVAAAYLSSRNLTVRGRKAASAVLSCLYGGFILFLFYTYLLI